MTLELGRIRTWRLPAFSALLMELRASWRTEVRTILAVLSGRRFSSRIGNEVSARSKDSTLASRGHEQGECPQRSVEEGSAAHC